LKKLHSQRKKEKEKEIKKKRGGEEEKKDQEQQQHEEEKCAREEWKRGGRGGGGGGPWRPFGVVFLKQEGEKGTGVGVELIMDPGDRWGDLRWVKRKKKPR